MHVQGEDMTDAMVGFKYEPLVNQVQTINERMARKLQGTPSD